MASEVAQVVTVASALQARGEAVALAVVVRTWRSSPRPVGSLLVVGASGQFEGSVSGGCVESAVVQLAQQVLRDGRPRRATFGVTQERAWQSGLSCGGEVEVAIVPFAEAAVADARAALARAHHEAMVWGIELASGRHAFASAASLESAELSWPEPMLALLSGALAASGAESLANAPRVFEADGQALFLLGVRPSKRLIVVGAVHLAQALLPLAAMTDFSVTIVDPRPAFSSAERFGEVPRVQAWPDRALRDLNLDDSTAVVVLSHDHKLDEPALLEALSSRAFYVGALGGRKTQAARKRRLLEAGLTEAVVARLHAPVGLAIGAVTPEEIAISIIAQIIQVWRARPREGQ